MHIIYVKADRLKWLDAINNLMSHHSRPASGDKINKIQQKDKYFKILREKHINEKDCDRNLSKQKDFKRNISI